MEKRKAIVAGQFYPEQHDSCIEEINEFLAEELPAEMLPENIVAGIVPHAGWTFSGALATMVFSTVKQQYDKVHTFVLFGAAHSYFGSAPAVYDRGFWVTPLGEISVDEELAKLVLKAGPVVSSPASHQSEHSIEVQVPFIQYLFPGAKILPILTSANEQAISLGKVVGEIISADKDRKIVCLGSTDLTHYGPHYGFGPMGTGENAFRWAKEVNDQQFIDLALKIEPKAMLASAAEHYNACGAGAAAAAVAAAKRLGKSQGFLLAHTTSNEVMIGKMRTASSDSVGYAAMVF